ncbi:unnamed protein product, partial [marine sediment metagenome]
GIGTTNPGNTLEVGDGYGTRFIAVNGQQGGWSGYKVMAGGTQKWFIGLPGIDQLYVRNASDNDIMVLRQDGNIGIGTAIPAAKLEVNGQVKITGGSPGAGKVLTSDAGGLASWQTPGGGLTLPYSGTTSTSGNAFSITNTGSGWGVRGKASGSSGVGVGGWANNTTGNVINYGGWFRADGVRARAVYGWATNQEGGDNYGGYFYAAGVSGRGVGGFASGANGWGVEGEGTSYGGIFTAASASGVGVRGAANDGYGVWGVAGN